MNITKGTIFTTLGAQVRIVQSFKSYADCGAFLVQAEVVTPSHIQTINNEDVGQLIEGRNTYSRGWIPANQLVSDQGPADLLNACLQAPDGKPANYMSLLRMHWPAIFGYLAIEDVQTSRGLTETPQSQTFVSRLRGGVAAGVAQG